MSEPSGEVFFASTVELNKRLQSREFSAVELARAFCDRLEKLAPRYNALALLLREDALQKASKVDQEFKRGRLRGPLQGVPFGAKDLLSVKNRPTAWGAAPFAGQVFDYDATALAKLADSRAVLAAKLAMVELAGGGGYRYAAASVTGPGLNPWDRNRWSGGSSSGSAATVAAGLVPYALGSETSGSIVTPCAFCGVTGLRPTYGLVSRHGAMPLAWTMDKIGPIARTAEDCGHILQAISGGDSNDPGTAGRRFRFSPQFARPLHELRAGFAPVDFEEFAEPALRPPLAEALSILRSLVGRVVEAELPDFPYEALTSTIISAEGATVFSDLIRSGRVEQLADRKQIEGLKAGLTIPASEYLQAMRIRRMIQQKIAALFSEIDMLIAPARFSTAPALRDPLDQRASTANAGKRRGLRSLIQAGNLAGLPALVLPAGLAEGLPVAISLVGRPFSENTLLKVGIEFQNRTGHHKLRPPL